MLKILLTTPFLAQNELGRAVQAVVDALLTSLEAGREAVSHVAGRDPQQLYTAGVSRAAVETLAESTSDGVVVPWFWLVLLGLPGIALYKAINTADSMIGHLGERYRHYGWAATRDANKHRSPNSGWPEAAFAGALDFSLGGSRSYGGEMVDLPAMGRGPARSLPYQPCAHPVSHDPERAACG
ncbi:MAG: cobalamin biosynthesis protein [Candidatus Devosia euplotis]|nr:cobalamin biosynthesis protein [Candidatus Devosia euplotis]